MLSVGDPARGSHQTVVTRDTICSPCNYARTVTIVHVSDDPSAPLGRRERKKRETHQAIRRAALDLALERGLEHLTVEAIAEVADVSPRTFFNYFSSKEDALVTDAARAAEEMRPSIVDRPAAESPLRVLRIVITERDPFDLMQADRDRAMDRQRLIQENPALMTRQLHQYSELERIFAAAIAERMSVDPDHDLRPMLLAGIVGSVLRVAVRNWASGGPESLSTQIDSAFDLLERGLLTEPTTGATNDE